MVDNLGGAPRDPAVQSVMSETPASGVASFLSTTKGKLILGGAIVVLLAMALGAIAVFFVFSQDSQVQDGIITPPPIAVETTTGAPVPVQRETPRVDDTFSFRNVFAPTVKPSVPPTPSGGTTPTGQPSIPEDTLYLESISVVDGKTVAALIWNGQTYTLGEGEDIPGTPWRVLDITGTTVTMLYGDTSITLAVGQALGK